MTATFEAILPVTYSSDSLAELYHDIRVSIVRVTPAIAEKWLTHNVKNRKLNDAHVSHLKSTILAGDMMLNGEAIIFCAKGDLLDGQHRLHACVKSGRPFDTLVVRNVSPQAFDTIDGGKKRSTGDVLQMQGEANAKNLASACDALRNFASRNGRIWWVNGGTATPRECERILSNHPGLRSSVAKMKTQKHYSSKEANMLHYVFSMVDRQLADSFAEVLASGSSDIERPFNLFREFVITNRGESIDRKTRAAKAIKAFNAEFTGERPKILRILRQEEFPRILGLNYEELFASV